VTTLAQEYRVSNIAVPEKITDGLDAIVDKAVGFARRRRSVLTELRDEAETIDSLAATYRAMSDGHLRNHLLNCRQTFRRQDRNSEEVIPQALAALREAADRRTGLRPFIVQIMGALALHRGYLAEMGTGEGKTLTAGLAAILAGWTRRPCHIVTVNDYLAERDADWLRPLYDFCCVTVGHITGPMTPADRILGYSQDITYVTSKEITADFLRDRLRLGEMHHPTRRLIRTLLQPRDRAQDRLVMRGLDTAIVDEADSVLIDEAVTPLIISSPVGNAALQEVYQMAWSLASTLDPTTDYRIDVRYREVTLLPTGRKKIEKQSEELPGLWRSSDRQIELIEQALNAREFFQLGKQYVIQNNKVVIVDEFTGRLMPMRKWRHGLHQAIEAKEKVEISALDETLARLSFQRFFRFFRKLSGMTGTAQEAAAEFWHIYRLPVICIPPNKPCQRQELPDRIFPDQESKWNAISDDIVQLHTQKRPILIGTRNISTSEILAEKLTQLGLHFRLLNATHHKEEAQIIAAAGSESKITIATNMAGRGTDIKLGRGVADLGGLHVIATERHESHRIDRQLFGRAARQGDPGSAQSYVSAEDELLRRFTPEPIRKQLEKSIRNKQTGSNQLAGMGFHWAQYVSQRQAFRQRKNTLRMDTWISEALSFTGASSH